MTSLALALGFFASGILVNAAFLHLGARPRAANVVIGEEVTPHKTVSSTVPRPPPPPHNMPSLSWSAPQLVDPSGPIDAVSCPVSGFCAAVDGHGQVLLYTGGKWSSAQSIDGFNAINSISCTSATFCLAVDQQGNALSYTGSAWSAPERIDKAIFPELTSVSCSSPLFCAAVDASGDGLTYIAGHWSAVTEVDGGGWSRTSRGEPVISCPTDGFCLGVDAVNNAFFYTGTWEAATAIGGAISIPALKYRNQISCSSSTFCVATQNPGNFRIYDGTQWSVPVSADPSNYLVSITCPTSNFCAAVDGLLPPGFNDYTSNGNGQVVIYNDRAWSTPREVDISGIVTAISCSGSNFCVVTDDSGHVVIGVS
jgi:hypothetical protein